MDEITLVDTSFSPFRRGSSRYRPNHSESDGSPSGRRPTPLLYEDVIVLSEDARTTAHADAAHRFVTLLEQQARQSMKALTGAWDDTPAGPEPESSLPAWLQGMKDDLDQERREQPKRHWKGWRDEDGDEEETSPATLWPWG